MAAASADVSGQLDTLVEELMEQRSATREAALAKVLKLLSHNYCDEYLERHLDPLLDGVRNCLKKGSDAERTQALRVLAVAGISVGTACAPLLRMVAGSAAAVVGDIEGAAPTRRAQALDTWALLLFIGSAPADDLLACIRVACEHALRHVDTAAAGLRAIGLLSTLLPLTQISELILPLALSGVIEQLQHRDVDTRLVAGETLALLLELARAESVLLGDEQPFCLDDLNSYENVDTEQLLDVLSALATERNRYQNKKDKSAQRSGFKSVLASVEALNFDPHELQAQRERDGTAARGSLVSSVLHGDGAGGGDDVDSADTCSSTDGEPPRTVGGSSSSLLGGGGGGGDSDGNFLGYEDPALDGTDPRGGLRGAPRLVLRFNSATVVFDSWVRISRLNVLRMHLGEGLRAHFLDNPVLHDIFDVAAADLHAKGSLSGIEKRLFRSQNSSTARSRTLDRSRNRDIRGSAFYDDDE